MKPKDTTDLLLETLLWGHALLFTLALLDTLLALALK